MNPRVISKRWTSLEFITDGINWHKSNTTHLPSLRNSIFHDTGHVGDRKVDVLLSEVLFDTTVVMIIHTLLCIVCTKQTHKQN